MKPPATVRLTSGKRVLFLTKDPDLIRRQLAGELELGVARRGSRKLRRELDALYTGLDVIPYDLEAARRVVESQQEAGLLPPSFRLEGLLDLEVLGA